MGLEAPVSRAARNGVSCHLNRRHKPVADSYDVNCFIIDLKERNTPASEKKKLGSQSSDAGGCTCQHAALQSVWSVSGVSSVVSINTVISGTKDEEKLGQKE